MSLKRQTQRLRYSGHFLICMLEAIFKGSLYLIKMTISVNHHRNNAPRMFSAPAILKEQGKRFPTLNINTKKKSCQDLEYSPKDPTANL